MKKKYIFGGIAVLAVATAVAFNVNLNSQSDKLSDLSLANVEALADGEGGTSVEYCYLQGYSSSSGFKKFCDSRTDNGTIYPCPSSESFNNYSESSKDRCTK